MNHQDSGTIIITFVLLLPWRERGSIGRRDMARARRNAKQESKTQLPKSTPLPDGFLRSLSEIDIPQDLNQAGRRAVPGRLSFSHRGRTM